MEKMKPGFKRCMLIISVSLITATIFAQIPATELFLFELTKDDSSHYHIHSPKLLSTFNSGGYTNQPNFFSDQDLYVSVRKNGSPQNDIYNINVASNTVRQVTKTPQNEFSPTRITGTNQFGCVREVLGESINQRLVMYPINQSTDGQSVLNDVVNVGYFLFTSPKQVGMFLVEDPVKLAVGDISEGSVEFLSSDIGRCLKLTREGSLVYVHKYSDDYWYLKSYNLDARTAKIIVQTLPGREDFCIAGDGSIFMADGSKLYVYQAGKSAEWQFVFDLAHFGLKNISRLAINDKNQIAIVNSP